MGAPAAAAFAVGTVISLEGQRQAASASRRAGRQAQALAQEQAVEILERAKLNQAETRREGTQLEADQVSAFAKAGVDVGSGSPLLVLENTIADVNRQIANIDREARFDAEQVLRGGQAQSAALRANRRANQIRSTTGLLSRGIQLAGATTSGGGGGGTSTSDAPTGAIGGGPSTSSVRGNFL